MCLPEGLENTPITGKKDFEKLVFLYRRKKPYNCKNEKKSLKKSRPSSEL